LAAEPAAASAAPGAADEPAAEPVPSRYAEARSKDEALEAHGLHPVRRTLGSRFRSRRKYRH